MDQVRMRSPSNLAKGGPSLSTISARDAPAFTPSSKSRVPIADGVDAQAVRATTMAIPIRARIRSIKSAFLEFNLGDVLRLAMRCVNSLSLAGCGSRGPRPHSRFTTSRAEVEPLLLQSWFAMKLEM